MKNHEIFEKIEKNMEKLQKHGEKLWKMKFQILFLLENMYSNIAY